MADNKYKNAPVSEVICGVTFKSNVLSKENYFLKLLSDLRADYPMYQILAPLFNEELSGHQMNVMVNSQLTGPALFRMRSADGAWLVQAQLNKIYVNWVRDDTKDVGNYPGYTAIYQRFKDVLLKVTNDLNLSPDDFQYFDLTYHDRIEWSEHIQSLSQINEIVNFKFPDLSVDDSKSDIANFNSGLNVRLDDLGGFLIFNFLTATGFTGKQILRLEFSLKGFRSDIGIDEWFDKAHLAQVKLFEKFLNSKLLSQWQ